MNTPIDNKSPSPISLPAFEESSKVFSGTRFNVHQVLLPGKNDKTVKREVVVHPGAVLILPLLDKEHIIMIRNYRFAVGQELWELPAGTLEKGEKPIEAAKRELIEETGYRAGKIEPLASFLTSPGFCNELMHTFVARDLTEVGQSLDENEQITVEIVSWQKALEMVQKGLIIDGKTITALLLFTAEIG